MKNLIKNALPISVSLLLIFCATSVFSQINLTINNTPLAGNYTQVGEAQFGPMPIGTTTGDLVIANDGIEAKSITDACGELINEATISDNIALIDRGSCYFVTKVNNAENAGATAAIICSIKQGEDVMDMSNPTGTDTNIPSIFLTLELCDSIRTEMTRGTVNVTISDK